MPSPRFLRQTRYQPLPTKPAGPNNNGNNESRSPRATQPPSTSKLVSWPLMAFILTSDLIGAGVLVVPKAYAKLGWIPAQLALATLFILTTYTGLLMVRIRRSYPHLTCYADLFEVGVGARYRWYARLCCSTLLFFVVCGSIMVQADSWNAVFPTTCNLIWIGVAAVSSCCILQIRSMPNIGLVSIVSVLLITVPNVIVLFDLNRSITTGIRAPAATQMFGTSVVESFVAILDLVFAFAGHVVFFELMLEMKNPDDFSKALWASQTVIALVYFVNGTYVYNLVGPAPWLKSPINLSMNDSLVKTFCQVFVVAHVSLAISVDGTVFIRSAQREFQPYLIKKFGLPASGLSEYVRSKMDSRERDVEDPQDIRLENMDGSIDDETDEDDKHERRLMQAPLIASSSDWSRPAVVWWLVWSAATLLVVAFLSIAVSSFDDIIGLTASLIASQTTVSWPAMFHFIEFYAQRDTIKDRWDVFAVFFDVIIFFTGIYLFVAGTWSNAIDIARMYERSPKSMFSCT